MGKVFISQNPIKSTERIDFNGNVIDPRTKQVIVPKEQDYVPPVVATTSLEAKNEAPVCSPDGSCDKGSLSSKIEEIVNRKVAEIVEKKIEEALKNI